MRFQTENHLEQFIFQDARVMTWTMQSDNMILVLDGAAVKGNNPNNEELTDRYVEALQIHFLNTSITDMLVEGYKYYDANDVLQEEVPDKPIPVVDYLKTLKECEEQQAFVYSIVPAETADGYQIVFTVDVEEITYLITIICRQTVAEWERFLNRVNS